MNQKLSREQIDRQDYVESAILSLLSELAGRELEHEDMLGLIRELRDIISHDFADREIMNEMEFYPYLQD
jgi:hypothetical protein